jgi:hypothetical protein
MNGNDTSLHALVDKWLAPSLATPARVTRFGRAHLTNRRYVCVEAGRAGQVLTIFFFRHRDGAWCVFPPADEQPQPRAFAAIC